MADAVRRVDIDQPLPIAAPETGLVRVLGTRQLGALIFNATVGSGIFALPALAVANLGAAAPLPYLLCAFLMGLVGLVYAEAGSRVGGTGGSYAYVSAGLGPFPGFLAGLIVLVSDVAAAGAVLTLLAGSLVRLLGLSGPMWEGAVAGVVILALAAVNVAGLKAGARTVELATLAKLLPLVAFAVVGVFFVTPAHLRVTALPSPRAITATAGLLLFAFTGIEQAMQPSGEVRHPERTVPRGVLLALGAVTVLYLSVQATALGLLGPDLAKDPVAPLAAAAAVFAGGPGRRVMLAAATISTFGWLTGSLLSSPRGLYALARGGLLPRGLAAVHTRFRTPHVAIIVYAAVALLLALSGSFEKLALLANAGSLAAYFLCALALLRLRRRGVQGAGVPFRVPGGALVPIGTCALIAWVAMQALGRTDLEAAALTVVAGGVLYLLRPYWRRAARAGPGPAPSA